MAYNNNHMLGQFHSLFFDDNHINISELLRLMSDSGLAQQDPRLSEMLRYLKEADASGKDHVPLDELQSFKYTASLLDKLLCGRLVIPDFASFKEGVEAIFKVTQQNEQGRLASYIPQLAKVDPDKFGMAICTIDGQQLAFGDSDDKFPLQSVSKPITYAMALEEHGETYVHQHVGKEPSGMAFNEFSLTKEGLPHNPMVNAGAIMSCSLIQPESTIIKRFESVMNTWAKLTSGQIPVLNQGIFFSEKDTADRNYAICYLMREQGAFDHYVNIQSVINLYFQCCSLEMNCHDLSIAAATLANSGLNPLSGERVFEVETVKNTLSLMSTCGMYDFSGEFFFSVGVPTKSGVSGVLMLVVPNVLGIAIYSPRLDSYGNSSRGVEFCKRLVEQYNFHMFDGLTRYSSKIDPTRREFEIELEKSILLCTAASRNSVIELKRLKASNVDLNLRGYDGRTALHYAASGGCKDAIAFLLENGVEVAPLDRWGNTPLDNAIKENHTEAVELLKKAMENESAAQ